MNALNYIAATQIEEIASQLEEQGYQIVVSPLDTKNSFEVKAQPYHLTATKCCSKEVFQAIERTRLTEVRNKHLREQAHQEGFTRFWVGITNPPFESQAEIEGVDQQLFDHLVANMPDHLAELPAEVQIERVTQVGFDRVAVTDSATRVVGNGVVEVEVANRLFDFPLNFDVELNHELRLKMVHDITTDTSSFYEDLES